MNTSFDVIVIGSGLGGLTAAALAAKRGKRVLVLEKHFVVGGYAQNFRRGEYVFDASLHEIGGIHSTFFAEILHELGIKERIEFLKPRSLFYSEFPGFSIEIPNGDPQKTIQMLSETFPNEKNNLHRFFKFLFRLLREEKRFQHHRLLSLIFAPVMMPAIVISEFLSVEAVLKIFFRDEKLRAILTQFWGYFGLSPKKLNAQYFFMAMAGYLIDGGFSIRGGSQQLSDVLAAIVRKNGGEVRTRTEVSEIIFEKDHATGVRIQSNEVFFAKTIISNISPHATYGNLLKKWRRSKEELKKIKKRELSMSGTQMYIALDKTISELFPAHADSHEIFLNPDFDHAIAVETAFSKHFFESNLGTVCITFFSNTDQTMSPHGGATLGVFIGDNLARWEAFSKEDYRQKKTQLAEKIFDAIDPVLPDLRKHVSFYEIGTPRTMQRYTGNPGGAIYGFAQTVSDGGFLKRFSNRAPMRNVFFASAWTFPGGGFEGVMRAGAETARQI